MTRRSGWKGRAVLANLKGEEHGSVTPYQITTVLVGGIIGVGVLAFPRLIVEEAGTGAPLAALLGAIPPVLTWLAATKLSRWFPKRTPAEYAPVLLTRPIGWLYTLCMILFMVVITALATREFGEVLKTAILPNTPIEVTIIAMLLTTAYFVRFDMQVFARVFEVFFPIMLVPLTIIGLLSLQNARGYYLMPLLGTDWGGVFRGALLASVGYVAGEVAIYLLPSLNRPKEAVKAGIWGLGLSAFVYVLVVTASLSVFGPEEIKRLVWPTFELVKTTTVPGFVLERLEPAFIGIWVAAVFTTVGATYYTAILAATQLFRLQDHKVLVIPLVPILYMTAMAPPDIHILYRIVTGVGLIGVVLIKGVTFVQLLIAWLLGKGGRANVRHAR